MADLTISLSADQWTKLVIGLYVLYPRLYTDESDPENPVYSDVVLNRTTDVPLLTSDGTGNNARELTDAQLSSLISVGKPADDTIIKQWWLDQCKRVLKKARRSRDEYLAAQTTDPFDDALEEI